MIKRLRVTVDGSAYDVTVEMADDSAPAVAAAPVVASVPSPASAPPAVATPVPPPAAPAPAPTSAPAQTASGGDGDVLCPLSGLVAAVAVKVGQEVKEGDHLVTLEAMKMNTFVCAPRSGKIVALNAQVGQLAQERQVLATIG